MKKLLLIALLPVLALLFAAQPHDGPKGTSKTTVAADSATVFFYRGSQFYRAGVNFTIRANGEEICRLSNKRYLIYKRLPGKVSFTSVAGGLNIPDKEKFDLELEAGKSYYIQCDIKTSFVADRMEMTEVMPSTAKNKMEKLTPDNCMGKAK